MSQKHTHTYYAIWQQDDEAACCAFEVTSELASSKETLDLVREAVKEWFTCSSDGRVALEESCFDFNWGDLHGYADYDAFQEACDRRHVYVNYLHSGSGVRLDHDERLHQEES